MKESLQALLERLLEVFGPALLPPPAGRDADDPSEAAVSAVTEALHAVSHAGLALLSRRNNFSRPVHEAASEVLSDPSLSAHARFQGLLFSSNRDFFGQVFPVQYVTKDVLPLYLRKYLQILEEVGRLAGLPPGERSGPEAERVLQDVLTFLANNWTGTVAVLRPSPKVVEGPAVEVLGGPPSTAGKVRALSNQIRPGLYLLSENHPPVSLHPFYYFGEDRSYVCRMATSDGIFFRAFGGEGYTLLFHPALLMDLGDFLFRAGAYEKALRLYRLIENENREAFIMVSALNHALAARALSVRGDYLRAATEWELALAVRPDAPVLYHEVASDYLAGLRHGHAAGALNRLLERYPVSDEGYVALGDVYSAKGDLSRAQRAYDKALLLNPHNAGAQEKKRITQERLETKPAPEAEKAEALPDDILVNLTQKIQARPRVPLVGREAALGQLLEILSCRDKHNALLVGEAGVGKTALVEELALRLRERDVPAVLAGRTVSALNLGALISGARFRGQFEERVLEVVRKVRERGHLLLVENLHHLVATGSTRGASLDSASLIKPALLSGDIQVIGITDEESYANILEKDPSFLKLFHLLRVEELSLEQVKEVVKTRLPLYEEFHGARFPEGLVENSLEMVRLSITRRALPESVLDLMDRVAARVALCAARGERSTSEVSRRDVIETLSEMSGVAYERLSLLDRDHLARMEEILSGEVVDQEEAVRRVSRLIRTAKLGLDLNDHRPDGVFLFVGPTGVGKTELARSIAKLLFGDEEKLIRIDMSEYMERISTSRLIGTAPGYVGYYDQNQLTDQVRKNPYCVILFDEVEKADPQVLNLFLQIFDAGRLTDGKGRTVRFHHATIIMTSNVGTHLFSKARVGYAEARNHVPEEEVLKEVRAQFSPEFLNRVDEVVLFRSLTADSLGRIVDLQLRDLKDRLGHQGKELVLEPEARALLAREGYSFEYGARNLGRVLRRRISEPMAQLALTPEWHRASAVRAFRRADAVALELLPHGSLQFEVAVREEETEGESGRKP
ncbi:MAG: AAA family ATPase [Acidobacteriota bacterium]